MAGLQQPRIKACDQVRRCKRLGKEAGRVGLQRTGADAFIGNAVTKMKGRDVAPYAHVRMFASSSRPFIGDICTSEITHDVSFN